MTMQTPSVHATIRMTIPDNQARTAFTTLRRLGVDIAGLERAELLVAADAVDATEFERAVRSDAALFNENTHELRVDAARTPGAGELWVAEDHPPVYTVGGLGRAVRLQSWRLFGVGGVPATEAAVAEAAKLLLCHPVVQRRVANFHEVVNGI